MTKETEVLIEIFICIVFLIGISFLLSRIWTRIFSGKKYQLIIFPGVVIHEISHALGCLVTGAKIDEISLFSSKGSYVRHGKPKVPIIGSFIISFSPIIGGIVFLSVLSVLFGFSVPETDLFSRSLPDNFFFSAKEASGFFLSYKDSLMFWIFSYFAISTVICLVPSWQDLKNSFSGVFLIILTLLALFHFGLFTGLVVFFGQYLASVLMVGSFFGILALGISLPIYFIRRLI